MKPRKYRGEYPKRICTIWIDCYHVAHIETHDGTRYTLTAIEGDRMLPKLLQDISTVARAVLDVRPVLVSAA